LALLAGASHVPTAEAQALKLEKPRSKTLFLCPDRETASQVLWKTPRTASYRELKAAVAASGHSLGCKRPPRKYEIVSVSTAYRRTWKDETKQNRLVQWIVIDGRRKSRSDLALIVEFSAKPSSVSINAP
jgi:superfamily II DNA or RNA helicase